MFIFEEKEEKENKKKVHYQKFSTLMPFFTQKWKIAFSFALPLA